MIYGTNMIPEPGMRHLRLNYSGILKWEWYNATIYGTNSPQTRCSSFSCSRSPVHVVLFFIIKAELQHFHREASVERDGNQEATRQNNRR